MPVSGTNNSSNSTFSPFASAVIGVGSPFILLAAGVGLMAYGYTVDKPAHERNLLMLYGSSCFGIGLAGFFAFWFLLMSAHKTVYKQWMNKFYQAAAQKICCRGDSPETTAITAQANVLELQVSGAHQPATP